MRNTITEHKFYKSKSIMIVAHSIGVNYGTAENYIEFKFATRPDAKSQGNWDDENRFFLTGYIALYNFIKGIDKVIKKKAEKYQISNPRKKTGLVFRINIGDDGRKWAVFHFFREDTKIRISLDYQDEFMGFYRYWLTVLENYIVISAISLFRNDYYFKNIQKNKNNGNGQSYSKSDSTKEKEVLNDNINDDIDENIDDIIDDMPGFDDDVPF